MDIIQSISDQIKIKLKINNKSKIGKFKIFWELNNQLIKEETIREFRKYYEMNKNSNTTRTYRLPLEQYLQELYRHKCQH